MPDPVPLPSEFWFYLGALTGAAMSGDNGTEPRVSVAIEKVYRILTERYPEMWPLKKYISPTKEESL
jgi:hypothetical protein